MEGSTRQPPSWLPCRSRIKLRSYQLSTIRSQHLNHRASTEVAISRAFSTAEQTRAQIDRLGWHRKDHQLL